jgi:hypothetical protein
MLQVKLKNEEGKMRSISMSENQVRQFICYMDKRIETHNQNMSGYGGSEHRMLVKTERAKAKVIRNKFLNILESLD